MPELRDELELPGEVRAWIPRDVAVQRVRDLLDEFEEQGCVYLKDIPEGEKKRELRWILRQLGQEVKF